MKATQHIEKLDKIYALFASTQFAAEKANCLDKLQRLCKKYKVDFKSFLEAKDFDAEVQRRKQAKEAEAKQRREEAEAKAYKATVKRRSRRSLIIEMLKSNMFDVESICEVLSDVYNYNDYKANKKAIAGTRYDLTTNKNYFFRTCDNARIVTEM